MTNQPSIFLSQYLANCERKTMIDTLIVPNTVKTIADRAFCRCTDVKRIILPESVEYIGWEAFAYCTGLEKIEASDQLQTVKYDAFLDVPDNAFNRWEGGLYLGNESHPYHCFIRPAKDAKKVLISREVKIFMEHSLVCDESLSEVFIPPEVQAISVPITAEKIKVYDSFPDIRDLKPGGLNYCTEITVISEETDHVKYIIPLYCDGTYQMNELLERCWRPDNTFNYEELDGYFEDISEADIKTKVALARIRYPFDLSESARDKYQEHILKSSRQIIKKCIEDNDLELLSLLGNKNLIKKSAVKPMIALASERGRISVTAYLLDYNNKIAFERAE